MNPDAEYDSLDYEEQKHEPGVPDEMVEAYEEEPRDFWDWNLELLGESAPLLFAAVLAVVLTEAVKPWAKLALAKSGGTEHVTKRAIQSLPYLFGAATGYTFGFSGMVYDLTGVEISIVEGVVYGGASVGTTSLVLYEFVHELRPLKVARLRFYRFAGVTEEELKTVRKETPVPVPDDWGKRKKKDDE